MLLVMPILGFLLYEQYRWALVLFFTAGVSDIVDGFLAKRHGWTSRLGGILDPLADKLLIMGSVLALGWLGELPAWLVVLVIVRDIVIVCAAISYHYWVEPFEAAPLAISKVNTLVQLALVFAIIVSNGLIALPKLLLQMLIVGAALTTLLSGVAYGWRWGRRALHKRERVDTAR